MAVKTRQGARSAPQPVARRHARARFWRRLIIRFVAIIAGVLGLAGIAGSVIAYGQIRDAQEAAQAQLREISDTFAQVSATLNTVSTSAANASTSVGEARAALTETAQTTRNAAGVLDQTAGAINFTVPGTTYKPLAGVDANFREQARQMRDLAGSVDDTNAAIGQNGEDLRAISADVAQMSRQMNDVSVQLRRLSGDTGGSLTTIVNGTRMLVIWSGVIHALLLAMGVSLYLLTVEDRVLEVDQRGGRPDVGDDLIEW